MISKNLLRMRQRICAFDTNDNDEYTICSTLFQLLSLFCRSQECIQHIYVLNVLSSSTLSIGIAVRLVWNRSKSKHYSPLFFKQENPFTWDAVQRNEIICTKKQKKNKYTKCVYVCLYLCSAAHSRIYE